MKTIICDIDGTILKHSGTMGHLLTNLKGFEVLPGANDKFNEWSRKGYDIILITARPESTREFTEDQLQKAGLFFDQLIMGVKNVPRYLINDRKQNNTLDSAHAINVDRDTGLKDVDL